MRCFYTGMLIPLFNYNFLAGKGNKKKVTTSVVEHILVNSLTRPNEVQKFVLETCKGVEKSLIFTEKHDTNNQFLEDNNDKLELGWYLREFGHRWTQIQLVGAALEYCKDKPEGSVRQVDDEELKVIRDKQNSLNATIQTHKLGTIHQTKPLLAGNMIADLYEIKAGKILKSLIDETISF